MNADDFIGTPLSKEITYIVEANRFERSQLWREYKYEDVTSSGSLITVGHVESYPVCISLNVIKVEGKYVLFYVPTSMLVSYYLIDVWFKENYPQCHVGMQIKLHTDAQNFHNVVAHCKELQLKELGSKLETLGYNLEDLDKDNPYTQSY